MAMKTAIKEAPTMTKRKHRSRPTVAEGGPHPVDVHVGGRVRLARLLAGRTQEWLGQQVGLTFQQIQKYESGTNRVGASNLYKIAKALDVDVAFFFEGTPREELAMAPSLEMGMAEPPPQQFEVNPMNSREAFELMHNYCRIPDAIVRKRLFQLIRILAFAEPEA